MIQWLKKRSLPTKLLIFVSAATLLAFLVVGVYATGTLVLQGGLGLLGGKEAQSPAEGEAASQREREEAASQREREEAASQREREEAASQREREEAASQQDEAEYVRTVGDIQARAIETFLESHEKLLRYDSLTAADVDEMQANETTLQGLSDRAADLDPPEKYEEQHDVFASAIDELREATRLAYGMAADPVAAAELGFDEYDGHVNEASALLRRSNELVGEDHEAIEGVREVSPEL